MQYPEWRLDLFALFLAIRLAYYLQIKKPPLGKRRRKDIIIYLFSGISNFISS